MNIVQLVQGSPEWHAHRAKHFNASDAAALLGLSSYKTRSQLLKEKVTGVAEEIDAATAHRFAKGHEFEAIARPWAEEIIGRELYPVVLADVIDGLPLSASLDGLDISGEISFENKTLNADLMSAFEGGFIPSEYHPQMEMGLMLSGASRCLFMASKGVKETMRYAWYESNETLRSSLISAWRQFQIDLESFVPVEHAEKPKAEAIIALPALSIQIRGEVALSNLPEFKVAAERYVSSINENLESDQDFADAEAATKFLDDAEKQIDQAKKAAIAQTVDIDLLMRTLDKIQADMRTKRLTLTKLVKDKKESIKAEIVRAGREAFSDHLLALNAEIEPATIKGIEPDFAGVIKNKRTLASLHDAVDTELARVKILASGQAQTIRANKKDFQYGTGRTHLFPDLAALLHKDSDSFIAIVKGRIAEDDARIAAKVEAEKASLAAIEAAKAIAAEEKAAIDKAAAEKIEAEKVVAQKPDSYANAPVVDATIASAAIAATPPVEECQFTAVLSEKASQPYAAIEGPTLAEIASLLAFDKDVDVKTARAWIINAVNQSSIREAA